MIDESEEQLTLSDERIEQAIMATNAKLFIIDPLQAYMGADVDMHRANEIRPVLKRISTIAEKTGCAVVVIGHLNKSMGKSQYRGLGSIDIQAAARCVLTVGRVKDQPYSRAIAQGKNNLAPEGKSVLFELDPETGFEWSGMSDLSIDDILGNVVAGKDSTYDKAIDFLKEQLENNPVPANEIINMAKSLGISERTLRTAKNTLAIESQKQNDKWYWAMPVFQ